MIVILQAPYAKVQAFFWGGGLGEYLSEKFRKTVLCRAPFHTS